MSTHKSNDSRDEKGKPEIGFGKKTDEGYKYRTRINFKEDLSFQIGKLMQEKKAKDELESHIVQIRKIISRFKIKEKNLDYYSAVGKALAFLHNATFKNIKPYSVFRRLVDEIPNILPELDAKRAQDHLMMMYRIGELRDGVLAKASWEQWYEISKFKNVISNRTILKKVLASYADTTGPDLRERIRSILSK